MGKNPNRERVVANRKIRRLLRAEARFTAIHSKTAENIIRQHRWNRPLTRGGWRLLKGQLTEAELNELSHALGNPLFIPHDILAQRYLLAISRGSQVSPEFEHIDPNLLQRNKSKVSFMTRQAQYASKRHPRKKK